MPKFWNVAIQSGICTSLIQLSFLRPGKVPFSRAQGAPHRILTFRTHATAGSLRDGDRRK